MELELIKSKLHLVYEKYCQNFEGQTANYIPELSKANKSDFAISITTVNGDIISVGDCNQKFTLQSLSKPFVYGLALNLRGKEFILSKVGVEPTGEAFNSIIELEKNTHRPYNPMINSGAIAISSFINGNNSEDRFNNIKSFFSSLINRPVDIDEDVFNSEKKTAHRNRAIAHLMAHFGIIEDCHPDAIIDSLDLYFKQCSILVNTIDLSIMAATLANAGIQPKTNNQIFSSHYNRDILSLMFTCGMYDTAGEWAYDVGLPAKSGVSGGVIAVLPGKLAIAAYSPLINHHGHSVRASNAISELAQSLNWSVFS